MRRLALLIHPATQILLWLGFAVLVQIVGDHILFAMTVLAILAVLSTRAVDLALTMLRRARWLLLSLLLIYGWATPGQALFPPAGLISPTVEGMAGGALQAWRLTVLLLGLALLWCACPRETLLSGLYVLLRPFRVMGVDAGQAAVRLWLTLEYVSRQPPANIRGWRGEWRDMLEPAPNAASEVILPAFSFGWRDGLVLGLFGGGALFALLSS